MSLEERVKVLEFQMANLQEAFISAQRLQTTTVGRVDDTSNRVTQITPYTDTKTAYYGETLKTFYDVPQGNVAIYFDNFNGEYTFEREEDRLYITFKEPITEQTNITISIQ